MSFNSAPKNNETSGESVPTGENTSLDFLDNMIVEAGTTEQTPEEKDQIEKNRKALEDSFSAYGERASDNR